MPENTAVETPAVETPSEKPAERTYSEDEHKALVEAAIKARLKNAPTKEEIAELRAKAEKADALEAEKLSDIEKAQALAAAAKAEAEAARAEAAAERMNALKTRIASEYELPIELAARLSGDDEDALKADAEGLAKLVKPKNVGAGGANPDGGNQSRNHKAEYDRALAAGDTNKALTLLQEARRAGISFTL